MSLLTRLAQEMSESSGLRTATDWPDRIQRALAETATPPGEPDAILEDPSARARLLEGLARHLTVGETHFFRHARQLEWVAEHLSRRAQQAGRAAVWSAGCSSGEEPYSIAMLLLGRVPGDPAESVDVLATDLNPEAIAKAASGVYTPWSFRGAPAWALGHFTPLEGGNLSLSTPAVRNAVRFEVTSCQRRASHLAAASLDAVLFRNVAIYFEPVAVAALYAEFARVLAPGGLLALGPSDPRPPAETFRRAGYGDHAPVYERANAAAPPSLRRDTPTVSPPSRQRAAAPQEPVAAAPAPAPALERPTKEGALAAAEALVAAEPRSIRAHRVRGQVLMDLGRTGDAAVALRRATFLGSDAHLSRFLYALALRAVHEPLQAVQQLSVVERELGKLAPDVLLEDGETTAGELLDSSRYFLRDWR